MTNNFYIDIPSEVALVLDKLKENNFEAYIVGGCVRDCLMGSEPKDWDITTSATPTMIKHCFFEYKVIETGIAHGTVTVVLNGMPIEVTTYRVDGSYSDSRHPDEVKFSSSIIEDLARRDFTINAIAYSPDEGLIDPFEGVNDIVEGVVRCVGDASLRFTEDALRIMRGLRFASQLSFIIAPDTSKEITLKKDLLKNISLERIIKELEGIITGYNVKSVLEEHIEVVYEVFPEIEEVFRCSDILKETLATIVYLEPSFIERFTVLLLPLVYNNAYSLEAVEKILRKLKFDRDTINSVTQLIEYYIIEIVPNKRAIKSLLRLMGGERLEQLIDIKEAKSFFSSVDSDNRYEVSLEIMNEVIAKKECFTLADLAINGNDLIEIGIPAGTEIGEILNDILSDVIDEKIENTKEILLVEVKKRKGR